MTLSFRSKLLASHMALVVTVGIIALFTLNRWLTEDLVRQLDLRLEEQGKGAVEWAEGGKRHPDRITTRIAHIVDAEVTLFDRDGTVLGASTPQARADVGPEVAAAHRGVVGHAARFRDGQEFHYVAVPGIEGTVLRLAAPLSEINETVAAMRKRLLVASTLSVLVAILLGVLASRVASRPLQQMTATATRLAQGDFDVPIPAGDRDEFGVLWRALKSLAGQLKARIGELVGERDLLSAILREMAEGVLVIDREGAIIVANDAAAKILDVDRLVGRPVGEAIVDGEVRALVEACMRGEIRETELEVTGARGAALTVYVRPLSHREGSVVAVIRDLTALRRLLTIRKDFVANVSHELRTPVTSIQGYAETLLRGKADAETSRQFVEIIHRQAQRIGGLVEQLLALSELEEREPDDTVREPVRILSVAEHVAETVRGHAESAGVDVTIAIDGDLFALADPEGLERAILNLVDNAIKYGKREGSVRIGATRTGSSAGVSPDSVTGTPEVDGAPPPKVVVTVKDDGPGIAPEHLPRLFERFYRVDLGRSRQHGGAGLGLSIVRHLVEAMGGNIRVESVVGEGTTFILEVPARPER